MENERILLWLEKGKLICFEILQGNTSLIKINCETVAEAQEEFLSVVDMLPTGLLKIKGKTNFKGDNGAVFMTFQNGAAAVAKSVNSANTLHFITPEQMQRELDYSRKAWEYDLLLKDLSELKSIVKELVAKSDKQEAEVANIKTAIKELVDDDEDNDDDALSRLAANASKISDIHTTFKNFSLK